MKKGGGEEREDPKGKERDKMKVKSVLFFRKSLKP